MGEKHKTFFFFFFIHISSDIMREKKQHITLYVDTKKVLYIILHTYLYQNPTKLLILVLHTEILTN